MYSKYPKDSDSNQGCFHESTSTECDDENQRSVGSTTPNGFRQIVNEKTVVESELDQRHSVLQMAFLQLMTRKVIEATANSSEVLKDLNSRIRADRN